MAGKKKGRKRKSVKKYIDLLSIDYIHYLWWIFTIQRWTVLYNLKGIESEFIQYSSFNPPL